PAPPPVPPLPTRSKTDPNFSPESRHGGAALAGRSASASAAGLAKRKQDKLPQDCSKCGKRIPTGRHVKVTGKGGGVLCEACWKVMYLPKCRRCDKVIEKSAISSKDGQLKGKYHKDCFNCETCQAPFPDGSFYVFDGKPFCEYHYHAANRSLCAAPDCGRPIEGACTQVHGGERFHSECLRCVARGCEVRLEGEYWEVDGRMLCERHAAREGTLGGEMDGATRATRRQTRMFDM
ncbi:hypothetical protein EXIGLDRAFT_579121, partial [Exidia glandulosa HHB12029]